MCTPAAVPPWVIILTDHSGHLVSVLRIGVDDVGRSVADGEELNPGMDRSEYDPTTVVVATVPHLSLSDLSRTHWRQSRALGLRRAGRGNIGQSMVIR